MGLFFFAEKLFAVFDKADDDHDGRTDEADEEHRFEDVHTEHGELHGFDCSAELVRIAESGGVLMSARHPTDAKIYNQITKGGLDGDDAQ